jgi:hypothetical protein
MKCASYPVARALFLLALFEAAALGAPFPAPVLTNDFITLWREPAAVCPALDWCVLIALTPLQCHVAGTGRRLARGEFVLVPPGARWTAGPGRYYAVDIHSNHPPGASPAKSIPPLQNRLLYDAPDFSLYAEVLPAGATRPAHTHNSRLTVVINPTALRNHQGELFPQVPDAAKFIPGAATHGALTNAGTSPLFNLVVEFKGRPPA